MKLKTSSITVLLFSLIIILSAIPAWSSVIYVSKSGNNANNGSTWGLAKLTVQAGLDAASSGDEVWVAAGTYVERITMKVGVKLYGGFVGSESQLSERNWNANVATLDGNHAGSVVTVPTGATSTTRIDGFTIRNGGGTASGGGISCSSSPTIANNNITNNSGAYGGGIYANNTAPIIEDNSISNNEATNHDGAGGIGGLGNSAKVLNNTIDSNSGNMAGGIDMYGQNILISGNTIYNCSASWGGGGIFSYSATNVVISDNLINNNTGGAAAIEIDSGNGDITGNTIADNGGRGIFLQNNTGDFTIKCNRICGNNGSAIFSYTNIKVIGNQICSNYGSAICSYSNAEIIGNYIASNQGEYDTAGIVISAQYGDATITNNTILYNTGPTGGHGVIYTSTWNLFINNNIIAFNNAGIEVSSYDSYTINNNDVYSNNGNNYIGVSAGTGDISSDPLFTNNYTFHIQLNSPCKDAGYDTAAGLSELDSDIDGDARVNGSHVDIGADEVWTTISSVKLRMNDGYEKVRVQDAVVTAEFGNYLYIESPDRSSGIRVDHSTTNTYTIGTKVNVDGWTCTATTGEKCITSGYDPFNYTSVFPTITITETGVDTSSFPLGMNNRTLGGGDFHYSYDYYIGDEKGQKGIAGAYGWNNIGLLVKIYGNVTSIGTDYLYINDGSDIKDGTQTGGVDNVGVKVKCNPTGYAVGDHLIITGISSCFVDDSGNLQRLVLTRGTSDITKVTTGENASFAIYLMPINQVGPPLAPFNSNPVDLFGSYMEIDDIAILRCDPIHGWMNYSDNPLIFGNIVLGDGVAALNLYGNGSDYIANYTGFPDGLKDSSGLVADMCISLPGCSGQQDMSNLISHPFNHNVLMSNCFVTDGLTTLSITDAITAGWLDSGWEYFVDGLDFYTDPAGVTGSAYLQPGLGYSFYTHKPNLSLIIPADRIAPTPGATTVDNYTSGTTISVNYSGAADNTNGSGLKSVELWYKKDSGDWTNSGLSSTTGSGTFNFTPDGEATYYFDLVAVDFAGNRSATPTGDGDCHTIYDTTGPEVNITAPLSSQLHMASGQTTLQITGTANDNGSGIASVQIAFTDTTVTEAPTTGWADATGTITWTYNWTNPSSCRIWAKATNQAGISSTIYHDISTVSTVSSVIYVDATRPGNNGDGQSWATAKKTVTAGLAAASNGTELWIAKGTYVENITLPASNIALYGGFTGVETYREQRNWKNNAAILDGNGNCGSISASFGVTGYRIDGFIIQNRSGGGISCSGDYAAIANNIIRKNSSVGINCGDGFTTGSTVVVIGNVITDNNGVGISLNNVSGLVANNTIPKNADNGIYFNIDSSASLEISNNIVVENTGYGMYQGGSSLPTFHNNNVYGNNGGQYNWTPTPANDISVDPGIPYLVTGDWHISSTSSCKNAGYSSVALSDDFDMDLESRRNGIIDIGADEWNDTDVTSTTPVIIYVKPESQGGDDNNGGTSWNTAVATVQKGIDLAADDCFSNEVWVAAGTYSGDLTLNSPDVKLYGGFVVGATSKSERDWKANQTIVNSLAGEIVGSAVTINADQCCIDGFIIQDGEYGGISCNGDSAVITNNIIRNNSGDGIDCGNYLATGLTVTVTDNVIMSNTGVGISLYSSNGLIANNTIKNNTGSSYTGGIYFNIDSSASLEISNNIIVENTGYGMCQGGSSLPVFHNNNVYGNVSFQQYSWTSTPPASDISVDPGISQDDWHISSTSSCKDAGYDSVSLPDNVDIDREPRRNGVIDIGADEYCRYALTLTTATNSTDINTPVTVTAYVHDNATGGPAVGYEVNFSVSAGTIQSIGGVSVNGITGSGTTDSNGNIEAVVTRSDYGYMTVTGSVSQGSQSVTERKVIIWFDDANAISNIVATPRVGIYNDSTRGRITITFNSSKLLKSNPAVTVNGHAITSITTSNGHAYSCTYIVRADDPIGDAAIKIVACNLEDTVIEKTETQALCIAQANSDFCYDDNGSRKTMYDSRGYTVYYYDVLGRTTKVVEPDGKWIAYEYDLNGNRTKMTTHSDDPAFEHVTQYQYNDRNLLSKVIDQLGGETTYTYKNNGLVDTITYPNGTKTINTYNGRNWLTTISNRKSDDTIIAEFTYEYDSTKGGDNGTRTAVIENILKPDGNRIQAKVEYTYDELYRLTRECRTAYNSGDPGVAYDYYYAYDAAGNRTSWQVVGGTTTNYTYDAANKMQSPGSFTYDDAGNTLTHTISGITTTYTWDYLNRMTRWEKTGETTQDYVYDAYGMRVQITPQSGTATDLLLDCSEIVEQITGPNQVSYVGRGLSSEIVGTTHTLYLADGLGSTRAINNDTEVITNAEVYDAYGNAVAEYPSFISPSFGYVGDYRYYTDTTGLTYLKARYYNSMIGRFISSDPIDYNGGLNRYSYVRANPVNYIDPTGLIWNIPSDPPEVLPPWTQPLPLPILDPSIKLMPEDQSGRYTGCMITCISGLFAGSVSPCLACSFVPPPFTLGCVLGCVGITGGGTAFVCHQLCKDRIPCIPKGFMPAPGIDPIPGIGGQPKSPIILKPAPRFSGPWL